MNFLNPSFKFKLKLLYNINNNIKCNKIRIYKTS